MLREAFGKWQALNPHSFPIPFFHFSFGHWGKWTREIEACRLGDQFKSSCDINSNMRREPEKNPVEMEMESRERRHSQHRLGKWLHVELMRNGSISDDSKASAKEVLYGDTTLLCIFYHKVTYGIIISLWNIAFLYHSKSSNPLCYNFNFFLIFIPLLSLILFLPSSHGFSTTWEKHSNIAIKRAFSSGKVLL